MKEFTWEVPEKKKSEGKDVNHPLKGTVVLNMPGYLERIEILKGVSFKVKDGTAEEGVDKMDLARKLFEIADKHTISLAVTHQKTKKEFKSLADMEHYKFGHDFIQEISQVIMGGLTLGED